MYWDRSLPRFTPPKRNQYLWKMLVGRLLSFGNLWYWRSDWGRQGWCIFFLNEELFGTQESSKSKGSCQLVVNLIDPSKWYCRNVFNFILDLPSANVARKRHRWRHLLRWCVIGMSNHHRNEAPCVFRFHETILRSGQARICSIPVSWRILECKKDCIYQSRWMRVTTCHLLEVDSNPDSPRWTDGGVWGWDWGVLSTRISWPFNGAPTRNKGLVRPYL